MKFYEGLSKTIYPPMYAVPADLIKLIEPSFAGFMDYLVMKETIE